MSSYRSPGRIVAELLAQLEESARGDARYAVSAEVLDDLRVIPVVDPAAGAVSFKVWARGAAGTWLIGTWTRGEVDDFIGVVTDLIGAVDMRQEGTVDANRRTRA